MKTLRFVPLLFAGLLLASSSSMVFPQETDDTVASPLAQEKLDGIWIGSYELADRVALLEVEISSHPSPRVVVLQMRPGTSGAESQLRVEAGAVEFELPIQGHAASFSGRSDGRTISGHVLQGEASSPFELRRTITIEVADYEEYEGAYELEDGRTVFLRRHDLVSEQDPHVVERAFHYLFDEAGQLRRMGAASPDTFFIGSTYYLPAPVEVDIAFVRDEAGAVSAVNWMERDGTVLRGVRADAYRAEEVAFPSGEQRLAGRMLLPAGKGPHPAVVLIHGLGRFTRNMVPFAIGDLLASHGIAVLAYDKRGVGASSGEDRSMQSRASVVADVLAAAEFLNGRPDIDPDRIGLFGISQGAGVAPMVAAQSDQIAFIVSVALQGLTGREQFPPERLIPDLVERLQAQRFSNKEIAEATALAELDLVHSETGQGWDDLERAIKAARSQPWFRLTWIEYLGASSPDHFYWRRYEGGPRAAPVEALREVDCPVLAIWGENDAEFPPAQHRPPVELALEEGGNRDYTLRIFPNANHPVFELPPGGLIRTTGFAEGYFDTIAEWVLEKVRTDR
jgi:pimeloyl-ACP methyl ester carboxylesterase